MSREGEHVQLASLFFCSLTFSTVRPIICPIIYTFILGGGSCTEFCFLRDFEHAGVEGEVFVPRAEGGG